MTGVDARTPPDAHRPWIADVALIRPRGAASLLLLPDAATAVVYRRNGTGTGELRVVGPRSRASYHPDKTPPVCVRARLRPGAAAAVFGVPASELLDRSVALGDLWGARAARWEDRLGELAAADPTLRGVARALPAALDGQGADDGAGSGGRGAQPRDALLREAVASLSAGGEPVAALARRLSVSERRLRELFADRVGLSPKHFARVQRVRAVLAETGGAGRAGRTDLAGLASERGYYDQSHMTADFRMLVGVTPAAFRAGRRPAPTPCTAAPAAGGA